MIKNDYNRTSRPAWRPRKIATPEQLSTEFINYAQYVEDNPLIITKVLHNHGTNIPVERKKHRPMTVESFSTYVGIAPRTWRYWRANREDLAEMIEMIENAIYDQLFCLAAANLVKANLISRKLGLSHKR